MANPAIKLHYQLFKAGMVNPMDELKRRGVAQCVIDEIYHDMQRRSGGYPRTSDVEEIGAVWRAAHGLGGKFSSGNTSRCKMAKERRDIAKRREMRRAALKGKIVGAIRKAANVATRIVKKSARGS